MQRYNIATAYNRKITKWTNKTYTWEEFVHVLSNPKITSETQAEYKKMNKDDKDNIKDVGGFVCGYLKDGMRKSENIVSRSMLTLDLDYASKDFWDDYCLLWGYKACIYSTHSSTDDKPRYRLIIPLNKDVTARDYEIIAEKIINELGKEQFDKSTAQANRLMFFPSISKDVKYFFDVCNGEALDVNKYLNLQNDEKIEILKKRQQDPLEKEGIIGAFCRVYFPISSAIDTFLDSVYFRSNNSRFTYKKGTSSNGLVVYEDKWVYSNHESDPCCGKLLNAFDLVRIHKFGELDKEFDTSRNNANRHVERRPSFKAMCDFACNDKNVKNELTKEIQKRLKNEEVENDDWMTSLTVDKKGNVKKLIENIEKILLNDTGIKGKIQENTLSGIIEVTGKLSFLAEFQETEEMSDNIIAKLRSYLSTRYGLENVSKDILFDAIYSVSDTQKYHPIKDVFLKEIANKGYDEKECIKEVEELFITYVGAEDTYYTRRVARLMLTGAIARLMQPGIKFDTVCVLSGEEGIGKSELIQKIGMQWYSSSIEKFNKSKETCELMRGFWIFELEELTAIHNSGEEDVKAFITAPKDVYRPAYGRFRKTYYRQCVFFGTTNNDEFLTALTGNRRYLPIKCNKKKIKKLTKYITKEDIERLWLGALTLYNQGETITLNENEYKIAEEVRKQFKVDNPQVEEVRKFLDTKLPKDWEEKTIEERKSYFYMCNNNEGEVRDIVCAKEICVELYGIYTKSLTRKDVYKVHNLMWELRDEWEKINKHVRYGVYGFQDIVYKRIKKDNCNKL